MSANEDNLITEKTRSDRIRVQCSVKADAGNRPPRRTIIIDPPRRESLLRILCHFCLQTLRGHPTETRNLVVSPAMKMSADYQILVRNKFSRTHCGGCFTEWRIGWDDGFGFDGLFPGD